MTALAWLAILALIVAGGWLVLNVLAYAWLSWIVLREMDHR